MKLRTGISASLCSSLLLGCASFPNFSSWFSDPEPAPALRVANDADAEYQRGKHLHRAGRYGEAQKAYLAALAIDPAHADSRNGLAALIGASGDLDRAIGLLIELSQDHPSAHVYANLGHAYQLKGRDFDARVAYQRALDLDPGNDGTRHRLQAIDDKLQRTSMADAMIQERALADAAITQATIEHVGPAMYAMRYPATVPTVPTAPSMPLSAPSPVRTDGRADHEPSLPPAQPRAHALAVELVNANGVTGLARQLRALLPNETWQVTRTRNHDNFQLSATRIEYLPNHRQYAQQFAQDIGIAARLQVNGELHGARLRIILGHDCKDFRQLKQRLVSETMPAAS
jgi:Tfp pilus assembly protein PilF